MPDYSLSYCDIFTYFVSLFFIVYSMKEKFSDPKRNPVNNESNKAMFYCRLSRKIIWRYRFPFDVIMYLCITYIS